MSIAETLQLSRIFQRRRVINSGIRLDTFAAPLKLYEAIVLPQNPTVIFEIDYSSYLPSKLAFCLHNLSDFPLEDERELFEARLNAEALARNFTRLSYQDLMLGRGIYQNLLVGKTFQNTTNSDTAQHIYVPRLEEELPDQLKLIPYNQRLDDRLLQVKFIPDLDHLLTDANIY